MTTIPAPTNWREYEVQTDLEVGTLSASDALIELELARCREWVWDDPSRGFWYWARRYWKLVDMGGHVRRLVPNAAQVDYLKRATAENVVLKPRKRGMSTVITARYFWRSWVRANQEASIVTHRMDATAKLFQRLKWSKDHLPGWMEAETVRSSAKELRLKKNNSGVVVFTAGGRDPGAGSDQDMVHWSEFALYLDPDAILASLGEAVRFGAWQDFESTPRGHNKFREIYFQAKAQEVPGRTAFFFPWYEDPKNRRPQEGLDLDQEEKDLQTDLGLDLDQLAFRRAGIKDLGRQVFDREYPRNDITCFQARTPSKFNVAHLERLLVVVERNVRPLDLLELDRTQEGVPFEGADSRFTVWIPPKKGHTYTIGADVAEGLPDGDYSDALVMDDRTCDMVAALHGHWTPGDYAHALGAVGLWYNAAQVAVERENHGHATLRALANEVGYPNIYGHLEWDQIVRRSYVRPGWSTNPKTKPIMMSDLREAVRDGLITIRWALFIEQAMTFSDDRRDKGPGVHWDAVIATAITWAVRNIGGPEVA
jgi:hypothetical protein